MNKKNYIITLFVLLGLALTWVVNALSGAEKWAILENFKKKQFDMLFESDLWTFSSEYSDIFDISKKANTLENIWEKIEDKRERFEGENLELYEKITTLEKQIKVLNISINNEKKRVEDINDTIIKVKKSRDINKKQVEILKNKINENRDVLLDYMVYIYKKWDTFYMWDKTDNLKSILLNTEKISEVIDDLYFKWIIQVAWKKLLDNHKNYVKELYMKKVQLEKQEENLKAFRKKAILAKKILSDKKKFKQRILDASKGKEEFYKKYIENKIEVEKAVKMKAFKERVKFNMVRDDILKEYNCEFIDLAMDNNDLSEISKTCIDINTMILNEAKLKKTVYPDEENIFSWPVDPIRWISAFFRDSWYKKDFWSEHDAIDIVVSQGTSIKAPADGYVVNIEKPTDDNYSYIALKHKDWYISIYGHLSETFVEKFQYVKAWETFAKTWWEFWTAWAGFLTTWPHLHLEVFKAKEYLDPLSVLDLSYIKYSKLHEKYKFKFSQDFKKRRWYEYEARTKNSRVFRIEWDNEIERQKYLINTYAVWTFNDWQMWIDESLDANIDPSFVMCIWLAETTLWKYLKTPYNIWNVWNTDSWATRVFPNARSWVYWMVKTLNNRYLSQYNHINQLSRYWNKDFSKPIYASSEINWHRNIIKCMSHLKWTYVPDDYKFRLVD